MEIRNHPEEYVLKMTDRNNFSMTKIVFSQQKKNLVKNSLQSFIKNLRF